MYGDVMVLDKLRPIAWSPDKESLGDISRNSAIFTAWWGTAGNRIIPRDKREFGYTVRPVSSCPAVARPASAGECAYGPSGARLGRARCPQCSKTCVRTQCRKGAPMYVQAILHHPALGKNAELRAALLERNSAANAAAPHALFASMFGPEPTFIHAIRFENLAARGLPGEAAGRCHVSGGGPKDCAMPLSAPVRRAP
jgi:hypothetical protein